MISTFIANDHLQGHLHPFLAFSLLRPRTLSKVLHFLAISIAFYRPSRPVDLGL